jgi:hypothetical protein
VRFRRHARLTAHELAAFFGALDNAIVGRKL